MLLRDFVLTGYNTVLYVFPNRDSFNQARETNPEFNMAVAIIIPNRKKVWVLTWGWWNFQQAEGLPKARPFKQCVHTVCNLLIRFKEKKPGRKKQPALAVGAD